MNLSCPGTSINEISSPFGNVNGAKPNSIEIFLSLSSFNLSVSLPVKAFVKEVFPWSI